MANEDSVLREVDQELAEDRQWAVLRQYGPVAIGIGAALLLSVGGWQLWQGQKQSVANAQSLEFSNAVEILENDEAGGRDALKAVAENSSNGYAAIARLYQAGSLAKEGDLIAAIGAYEAVASDGSLPKRLREQAQLRAAYYALDADREAVTEILGPLLSQDDVHGYYAKEIAAFAAFRGKEYASALTLFSTLENDFAAPAAIRRRARNFVPLAAAGRDGVNLTGEFTLEGLDEALGVEVQVSDDVAADAPIAEDASAVQDETAPAPDAAGAQSETPQEAPQN